MLVYYYSTLSSQPLTNIAFDIPFICMIVFSLFSSQLHVHASQLDRLQEAAATRTEQLAMLEEVRNSVCVCERRGTKREGHIRNVQKREKKRQNAVSTPLHHPSSLLSQNTYTSIHVYMSSICHLYVIYIGFDQVECGGGYISRPLQ